MLTAAEVRAPSRFGRGCTDGNASCYGADRPRSQGCPSHRA